MIIADANTDIKSDAEALELRMRIFATSLYHTVDVTFAVLTRFEVFYSEINVYISRNQAAQ